jgi:hypothetical protein
VGAAVLAEEHAVRSVAGRGDLAGDVGVRRLVDRLLAASAGFGDLWAARDVQARRSARKRLRHPVVGWLDLDCEALHDPDRDQWVVLYTAPPGTPSHEALRLLKVVGTQDLAARG